MKVAILANMPRHSTGGNTQGRGGGHGATWLPPLADAFMHYPGLEITWVTFDWNVKTIEIDSEGNQQFVRVPISSDLPIYLLNQWPSRIVLKRILKRISPDVVHAWGTECLYAAVLQDMKCPTVLSVQGCLTAFLKVWKASWRHRVLAAAEPKRVREADLITCESPWSAEQVAMLNPAADIRVVDYGVHPSFYNVEWAPERSDPKLVFSGSLDYRKGADILFDALERIPDRKWTCQILGDGPMRAELEARKLDGVEWLGTLPWRQMQQHLAKAWGLVVPTRADTGPTVVKEARVIGLPVIGSIHGGLRDYIRHKQNGILVDPIGPDELASACVSMMESYDHTHELGLAQRDQDREFFRPERTAAAFNAIYQEVCSL